MAIHIAAALLVFSLVQLWATAVAVDAGGPRWMPLLGIAILMLGAIPFARTLERRWNGMGSGVLPSRKVASAYRRDLSLLWLGTLIAPMVWVLTIAQWFSSHALVF